MLNTTNEWNSKWQNIFLEYQKDLRHAYYINAIRKHNEIRLLEIAAGSFRDMAALNNFGVDCNGVDFSKTVVECATERFPWLCDKISVMDAFNLDFNDKEFDLSYHNGLWVCFQDDKAIGKLLSEQIRVTRHRVVATVHNKHNKAFVQYFEKKVADGDNLFDIRFFEYDEIYDIMRSQCRKVHIIPVGKAYRSHEDTLIRYGLGTPFLIRNCFRLSGNRLLEKSERLLCIGDI